jgi:hypothetical protein
MSKYPTQRSVYGGLVLLPDGSTAMVYSIIGPDGIEFLEVEKLDKHRKRHLIPNEEMTEKINLGERTLTLEEYVLEEILPYVRPEPKKEKKAR